jgi:hypothetical protein
MSSKWINQYFVKFKEICTRGIHQSYRKKLSYGTPWGVPPPLPWCPLSAFLHFPRSPYAICTFPLCNSMKSLPSSMRQPCACVDCPQSVLLHWSCKTNGSPGSKSILSIGYPSEHRVWYPTTQPSISVNPHLLSPRLLDHARQSWHTQAATVTRVAAVHVLPHQHLVWLTQWKVTPGQHLWRAQFAEPLGQQNHVTWARGGAHHLSLSHASLKSILI